MIEHGIGGVDYGSESSRVVGLVVRATFFCCRCIVLYWIGKGRY